MDAVAAMRRALRLASLSAGMTWPNPGVGCVLVQAGVIIGEGRHQRCGDLHAETAALADCRAKGHDPAGATAYVTLAPCTRQGRQPPCTTALIAAGVAHVVAAVADPHQDEAGAILAAHGISYAEGLLSAEALLVHGGFLTRIGCGRPRFTGKWAMSLDGAIADSAGQGGWLSSPAALVWSRRRRRAYDAILIGAGTATADDPSLLATRPRWHGDARGPVRIVLSAAGRLGLGSRLVATLDRAPLWLVHDHRASGLGPLQAAGVRTLAVADAHQPDQVAAALGAAGLNEVLVEGGATIHGAFLRANLYDRIDTQVAARTLGGGLPAAGGWGQTVVAATRWTAETPPVVRGDTVCLRLRRNG